MVGWFGFNPIWTSLSETADIQDEGVGEEGGGGVGNISGGWLVLL